jgi:hypothetical protein
MRIPIRIFKLAIWESPHPDKNRYFSISEKERFFSDTLSSPTPKNSIQVNKQQVTPENIKAPAGTNL